jgi:hypothetical protein
MKTFIRWIWFRILFGQYEWYRKLHGGKWMMTHIEEPVYSVMWLDIPDDADETYREYNWRGTPIYEDHTKENK